MIRRLLAVTAVLCLTAGAVAACSDDDGPTGVATQFAAGLPTGQLDGIGFRGPDGEALEPAQVYAEAKQLAGDLDLAALEMNVTGEAAITDGIANIPVAVNWKVRGQEWHYTSAIRLQEGADDWRVLWAPTTLHLGLHTGEQLRIKSLGTERGSILDRDGKELFAKRPVVVVGIEPRRVTNQASLLAAVKAALHRVGVDISVDDLSAQLEAAKPDAFVEVVTLRRDVYQKIRSDIRDLPGTVFREQELVLAPSREFARALLGTVGNVRKDQMDANPGVYEVGDQAGQSGLQQQYDAQLRGVKGFRVVVAVAGDDADESTEVFRAAPIPGKPLATTLDQGVQRAADAALAGTGQRSALVAIRVSDGAIVAVANGPDGGELNLAFTAHVPPGSTFKMVSALALLNSGAVTAATTVNCPKTYTVSGRAFHNSGGFELGAVPFHTDFAKSCNTAFAALAEKLGPTGLADTARSLGIGTAWPLGAEVDTGSVQANAPAVESAAAAFGQGQTVVSPVAMAAATAAVARGSWTMPTLLPPAPTKATGDAPAAPANGTALPADSVSALHSMMREVVTAGTATSLADVPGGPVFAKTGTAEYDDNPDHTHAWTVGWQGDIAFAVFVEKGGSSSATAVPIVERFLRGMVG